MCITRNCYINHQYLQFMVSKGFYKLLQLGSETTDSSNAFENSGISFSFFSLSCLFASSHFWNVTYVLQSGEETPHGTIIMVLPRSEIPEWFGDKGIGSSLTIQLPSNCHQPKGIAFYLVFLLPLPPMTCFINSLIVLMFMYILITMLRVKTVSMMVMMKASSLPGKDVVHHLSWRHVTQITWFYITSKNW